MMLWWELCPVVPLSHCVVMFPRTPGLQLQWGTVVVVELRAAAWKSILDLAGHSGPTSADGSVLGQSETFPGSGVLAVAIRSLQKGNDCF